MTGPVHMNQVIFQTPTVEKIQQAEHQNPDQTQRQATVESQAQLRQKTETVQDTVESEDSRFVENEEREKQQERRRKRRQAGEAQEAAEAEREKKLADGDSGSILDIVI